MNDQFKKVVVTGGTDFLGKATSLYLQKFDYQVKALGDDKLQGEELTKKGIQFEAVDLLDKESVLKAFKDAQVVVHCAELSLSWGNLDDFFQHNVMATQNVVDSCLENGVKRLIHVSSSDIYFELKDKLAIDESHPIPHQAVNCYVESKYMAELVVQEANSKGLWTIRLRPHGIFGPESTTILQRIIENASENGLQVFKGRSPVSDITYVDNVAKAIYLSIMAKDSCGNKVYNITNGHSVELIPTIEKVLNKLELPFKRKLMPYEIFFKMARYVECFYKRFKRGKEPFITRYKLGTLTNSITLDISAARKDLNYAPDISVEEGLNRYVKWLKEKKG